LEYLVGNTSHPLAEEIYQSLKPRFPSLSMATVYSTVEVLARGGELQELNIDPVLRRFDPALATNGHFLCSLCGVIYDIKVDLAILKAEQQERDFLIEGISVSLYGRCPNCKNKDNI
jgi:Fur family peroxide stress response transcriptional regulator